MKSIVFAFFCLLAVSFSAADTDSKTDVLRCFSCSTVVNATDYHPNCGDESGDVDSVPKVTCRPEENACFKYVTVQTKVIGGENVATYNITSRLCGAVKPLFGKDKPDLEDCEYREAGEGYTRKCKCGSDLCNTSEYIRASVVSLAIATVASVCAALLL